MRRFLEVNCYKVYQRPIFVFEGTFSRLRSPPPTFFPLRILTISSPFLQSISLRKYPYLYFSVCSSIYRRNRAGISFFFSASPSALNNSLQVFHQHNCRGGSTRILSSHSLCASRPMLLRKVWTSGMSATISFIVGRPYVEVEALWVCLV